MIDGFRLQSLYQGLEACVCNSRKSPGIGKLVDTTQVEVWRNREAIDKAGRELFNRVISEGHNSSTQSARRVKIEILSEKVDTGAGGTPKSVPTSVKSLPATPLIGQPMVKPPVSSLSGEQISKETDFQLLTENDLPIKERINRLNSDHKRSGGYSNRYWGFEPANADG